MNNLPKKDAAWDETVDRPLIGKAERWGRKLFCRVASFLIPQEPAGKLSLTDVQRILIVKEPYRMGDLLQITPILRALKKNFSGIYIGLVIQDRNLEIFKNNPDVNEILLFEKKALNRNLWKFVSFIRKLREKRFDLAVTLETERTHLTNDLICYLSGAPLRLRYEGRALGNPDSDIFYNILVPYDTGAIHEVDKNFAVLSSCGLRLDDRSLRLQISETDLAAAKKILDSVVGLNQRTPAARLIVIHPGAYKIHNRWPLENYLELARQLRAQGKMVVFLLGPAEGGWETRIGTENFPVISEISLLEMAGIFTLCAAVVCNDTGILHIAGAVGAKTVALFGETEPERWKPAGDRVQALRSPDKKVTSIEVGTVLEILSR